ncbi:MAG: hypothetical protein PGN13_05465 [Patulibacter minatonensis]
MSRFVRSVALLTLATAALAGCGGGDDPKSADVQASTPAAQLPPLEETSSDAKAEAKKTEEVKPTTKDAPVDETSNAPTINGSTPPKSRISKEDAPSWVNKANSRCRKYRDAAEANAKAFEKKVADDPSAIKDAMSSGLPIARALLKDLRRLDVPADATKQWNAFLNAFESTFEYAEQFAKAQADGKTPPQQTEAQNSELGNAVRDLLAEYPLTDCVPS